MTNVVAPRAMPAFRFAWLEITGLCQLECVHCYADSSPDGSHGRMTLSDWQAVITDLVALGVPRVQFIGGEPTLHPDFEALVRFALASGLEVEVCTNLVKMTPALWELFGHPRVRLATSYYSAHPSEHEQITGAANSHRLTTRHIAKAVRRGIRLRVGGVRVIDGQHFEEATQLLRGLGVTDIHNDDLRGVGRGGEGGSASELCGNCTSGVIAVTPSGLVYPCVMARSLPIGNVLISPVSQLVRGRRYAGVFDRLTAEFASRPQKGGCDPDWCLPRGDDGPSDHATSLVETDICVPSVLGADADLVMEVSAN